MATGSPTAAPQQAPPLQQPQALPQPQQQSQPQQPQPQAAPNSSSANPAAAGLTQQQQMQMQLQLQMQQLPAAKKLKPTSQAGMQIINTYSEKAAGAVVVPGPAVPPPTADSQCMKTINAKLEEMWASQKKEVNALKSESKAAFKHQSDLPLARIKRVMKSDEDVRMISAEAPILFAKACEMFVLDLTIRCYAYSEHNKRTGLEREDVFQVLKETDVFDFLAEVLINHPVQKGS